MILFSLDNAYLQCLEYNQRRAQGRCVAVGQALPYYSRYNTRLSRLYSSLKLKHNLFLNSSKGCTITNSSMLFIIPHNSTSIQIPALNNSQISFSIRITTNHRHHKVLYPENIFKIIDNLIKILIISQILARLSSKNISLKHKNQIKDIKQINYMNNKKENKKKY